jgi:hypothetical protein
MIHFDFIVSDADAENILGCIQGEINSNNELILDLIINKKDESVIKTYKNANQYLIELKSKMKNKRV